MKSWSKSLDGTLVAVESRTSAWFLALCFGSFLYLIAYLLVYSAGMGPGPHGWQYMELSEAPFNFEKEHAVGYRRLAPIIAWAVGLRGTRFLWFTSIAAICIPALLYAWARQRSMQPSLAAGLAVLGSLNGALFIHFIAHGYVDPVYYCMALVAFMWREKWMLSATFLLMAIMTHECVWVLAPGWLWYGLVLDKKRGKAIWTSLGSFLAIVILWFGWRFWLESQTEAVFGFGFYFSWENVRLMLKVTLPMAAIGAFYALKLGWALPLKALTIQAQKAQYGNMLVLLLMIGGVSAQLFVALDTGRLFTLLVPIVPVSLLMLHQEESLRPSLSGWIWRLNAANLLLLFYYVAAESVHPLLPFSFS